MVKPQGFLQSFREYDWRFWQYMEQVAAYLHVLLFDLILPQPDAIVILTFSESNPS